MYKYLIAHLSTESGTPMCFYEVDHPLTTAEEKLAWARSEASCKEFDGIIDQPETRYHTDVKHPQALIVDLGPSENLNVICDDMEQLMEVTARFGWSIGIRHESWIP